MQHRHGQDERQIEPVGDIDMRFGPAQDREHVNRQIADPDNRQPDIDIPFRLGIFLALGDPHQIAGGGQHDEQLIPPEHETGEAGEGQPRPASTLDHVKRRGNQRVASEREDDRRRVQRAQTAEVDIFDAEVERGKRQFECDVEAGQKSGHAPEHRGDDRPANHFVIIFARHWRMQDAARDRVEILAAQGDDQRNGRSQRADAHVHRKTPVYR